jgi:hypothetical protein
MENISNFRRTLSGEALQEQLSQLTCRKGKKRNFVWQMTTPNAFSGAMHFPATFVPPRTHTDGWFFQAKAKKAFHDESTWSKGSTVFGSLFPYGEIPEFSSWESSASRKDALLGPEVVTPNDWVKRSSPSKPWRYGATTWSGVGSLPWQCLLGLFRVQSERWIRPHQVSWRYLPKRAVVMWSMTVSLLATAPGNLSTTFLFTLWRGWRGLRNSHDPPPPARSGVMRWVVSDRTYKFYH